MEWATDCVGATRDEGNNSVSAPLTGFESRLSPTSVGSDLLIDSVQGFRRLKNSASTAWLYAIAHIRGLRSKESLLSQVCSVNEAASC
jgi:hypothetical protein